MIPLFPQSPADFCLIKLFCRTKQKKKRLGLEKGKNSTRRASARQEKKARVPKKKEKIRSLFFSQALPRGGRKRKSPIAFMSNGRQSHFSATLVQGSCRSHTDRPFFQPQAKKLALGKGKQWKECNKRRTQTAKLKIIIRDSENLNAFA